MRPQATIFLLLALLAAASVAGCAPKYYAEDADKQVYALLRASHEEEFGRGRNFSIAGGPAGNVGRSAAEILGELPLAEPVPEWLAESELARLPGPVRQIDLAAALRLAWKNSRQYQTKKETVYLAGLALSTQIHSFENIYALSGGASRRIAGAEPDRYRTLNTQADFSVTRDLITGATIALDVGLTGVKYINHELGTTLQSALGLTVTQPLWRGADRRVVLNNLTQAEHNVFYALRTFARYEKSLAIDIASSYYRVLVQLDRVKNQWNNYQNLIAARKRNEQLADEGRLKPLEVDQARQSELAAHNSYLVAVQSYETSLDAFRVKLGVPTDAPVVLSRGPLEELATQEPRAVDCPSERAVALALERRLDLKNNRGGIQDADREIVVAGDALKGDVNLVAQMNVTSTPNTRAGRFLFHEGLYEFGLELDLPLERLSERNALRAAMIAGDAAIRDYMDLVDGIKQDVRGSLRELRRTVESVKIQKASVELARRRVAGTRAELEWDRATTRDLLESQDALVTAENAYSEALAAHKTAWLNLLLDLEMLEVDQQGQVHEGDVYGTLNSTTSVPTGNAGSK